MFSHLKVSSSLLRQALLLVRPLTGVALLTATLCGGAAAQAQVSGAKDLSGVWLPEKPVHALSPSDGTQVPFTADGRQKFQQHVAELKAGKTIDATTKYCLPDGTPRLLTQPRPFEIVQTEGLVTFLHEAHHVYRVIPLDAKQQDPDAVNLTFMGNAVGRWDGDTLVIDSIGFNANTTLDEAGMPHSDALHVVERWRKIDAGKRLSVEVQLEDPAVFSKPWSTRLTFVSRPDLTVQEYVCGETHRAPVTGRGSK